MAPHSSILAWEIPWTEEPGGLQPLRPRRVKHKWVSNNNNNWIDFAVQQKITQHYYSSTLRSILKYIYIFHLHIHMATFTWLQRLTVSFTVTIQIYPITADAESIITSPRSVSLFKHIYHQTLNCLMQWEFNSHRKRLQNTCRHQPNIWLQFVLNKAFCICHTCTDQKQSQYYTWLFLL